MNQTLRTIHKIILPSATIGLNTSRFKFWTALLAATSCLSVSPLRAEVVTQLRSLSQGHHWNRITTSGGNIWSNGEASSSGNDYVNSAYTLRTNTSSSSFGGGSLTLQSTGSLLLKAGSSGIVHTVDDLILAGGSIVHGDAGRDMFLAGAITLSADSTYSAVGTGDRVATLSASISGSSVFFINLGESDSLAISSSSNAFGGEWRVTQNDSGSTTDFLATGNGSLGNADVTIGSGIKFDADYDINNSTKTLDLNGLMTLDQDHTFGIVQINGDTLAAGTYSFADLNATYDAFFVDGGTGSLTVVPEPSVYALLSGVLAFACIAIRRRFED